MSGRPGRRRQVAFAGVALLLTTLLVFVVAELAGRIYVNQVALKGRLLALVGSETRPLRDRGVRLLVAQHVIRFASEAVLVARMEEALEATCGQPAISCLRLDPMLRRRDGVGRFQRDGHWNAAGHATVAEALARWLDGEGRDPDEGRDPSKGELDRR